MKIKDMHLNTFKLLLILQNSELIQKYAIKPLFLVKQLGQKYKNILNCLKPGA